MILTVNIVETDFSTEIPLVVDAGGISINGDSNPSTNNAHVVTVDDNCPAVITVNQTGFHPYEMTVDNVYAEDKTITIIMVPVIADINDPNYLRPRPSFFTFQGICDFCIDAYFGSSIIGNTSWYVNNIEYEEGTKIKSCFCNPGEFQIKVRNQTSQFVVQVPGCPAVEEQLWDQQYANLFTGNTVAGDIDPIEDYLALDTETNIVISEYRPDLSLEATSTLAPLTDQDTTCYSRNEIITITPSVTLNREGADPDFHTIEFKVIDPEGFTIEDPSWTFPLTLLPNISIQFEMSKIGTYTVISTLEDLDCGNTFEKELQVETCNFVYIQYNDCGTYTVTNRSSATQFSYTVTDVDTSATGSMEGEVAPTEVATLNFTNQSLYLLEVKYTKEGETTETTETYVINNYCSLEQCFTKYIEQILCGSNGRCTPCPPESDLNQMFFFYNTYFMKIHKMFNTNSFYAALDEEGLNEITTIQQLMANMYEYCQRVSCSSDGYKNTYLPEGPYDWAGQGSNVDKTCNCNPTRSAGYYNPSNPGYCGTCNGKV